MSKPECAVIIPHYNDLARLVRCLEALLKQDTTGVEIVVVDNASPVDLSQTKTNFPQVRFVTQKERGAAAARNRGVEETTAPWLAFLDADCVPAADWLDRVRTISAVERAIVTGGRISVFDESPPPRSGAEAFETVFAFDQARYIRVAGFSVTANLVTKRTVFEATGQMVGGLSEDVDWCHRATAAGAELCYDPKLVVAHPTRGDWQSLRKKWQRMTRESFGLLDDGSVARSKWFIKASLMPVSFFAHAPRILIHPELKYIEKLRALATLLRLRHQRMVWMICQVVGRDI